ncbi:MAG: DUF1643 domain-containing protein [Pirellulaceae bacterium]|nr:DUF1643 domain-containing protein [Pirellulaceae bacterium]
MKLQPGVAGDANPRGESDYRHWLARTWDPVGAVALVVGINPNTATESEDDAMTGFLTRLLRALEGDYKCGSYILVNCCDIRGRHPKELKDCESPCSPTQMGTIREKLAACHFVVASWGTTDYGRFVSNQRELIKKLIEESGKPVICFSPEGSPIYCSQTSANSPDGRWSKSPVLLSRP